MPNNPSDRGGDEVKARARLTDPQTSHDAANSVKDLTGVQERILKLFELPHAGYTDEELIRAYNSAYGYHFPATESSIRSRRSELVHRQYLADSGQRRLTKAGRGTTVWSLFGRML